MSTTAETIYFECSSGREATLNQFQAVRRRSRELSDPLEIEDFVVQSMTDASPTRWHLAHTTWFFETFVLKPFRAGYESPNEAFAYLFNSYYVQAGKRYPRPKRGLITRPTVREVFDYRRGVDREVLALLEETEEPSLAEVLPIVQIGIHHEQQHQELMLTDLKHAFSLNPLHPVYRPEAAQSAATDTELSWHSFESGLYAIGHDGKGFCYDNEMPRHRCYLDEFELADRLVTNREYLEFMEDGGYRSAPLWLDEGWQTAQNGQWEAPLYWEERDGEWHCFTLHGFRPVVPEEPVCHLSYYEADAYARWAGARLPREEEWEVAAAGVGREKSADALAEGNFVDDGRFHPAPAGLPAGQPRQLFGDLWEWTASPYVGYPGFRASEGALGEYNGKFMINQIVLRGGSCATSRSHIRATYRNFFHPDKRWQFAGIRLAR